ncbi:thioredoxin fold domain-containing protein [Lamprobacter modestohalophilus]|uniref:thioredoxin family protein n=1 Tax=Lamprobacter modestohalophilus TaxID=1064514 RepID=UPI002ADEBFC0|nr:thioredoxin fold domain-containing protein [Lamprobacter modestohalophilus]MEA1050341.1 thioredoxin fold domain-containing protein [Lamprobacter modestohalophilus]
MPRSSLYCRLIYPPTIVHLLMALLLSVALPVRAAGDDADPVNFSDLPRDELLSYPEWFNDPFLDLRADLEAARKAGKRLILYFGQKRCPYCHQLMDVNFGTEADIVEYTRRHFDITPIDIWGVAEVTDLRGRSMTERGFSLREQADFTPTLIFYDERGDEVLRLRGYYPPYQFRAALEYVADEHYRRESLRDYLARGDNRMVFDAADLNDAPFFQPPPYNLERSRLPAERPLAVFFEQGDCHPCDVLHGQSLQEQAIAEGFANFDSIQLDMWSQTPVITPSGERTTASRWASELGLFYAPAVVFFDEQGQEILRVDSVVGFYRLRNVLNFITSKAYLQEPSYQRWRVQRAF